MRNGLNVSTLDNSPPTLSFAHGMHAAAAKRDAASRPTTVVIGASDRVEFREATDLLREVTTMVAVPSVEAAVTQVTKGGFLPDFIVIAQSRPGEFAISQIDRLRRLVPVARIVGLLGPWCEGEARTGKPWPGAVRIYWYHWLPQCSRAVAKLLDGACPSWGLPVTANDEDRLLAASVQKPPARRGLITIATWHAETGNALADACRACGYRTRWLRPDQREAMPDATAALWVGGDMNDQESKELKRLADQLPGVPIIALLDFPRVESRARARACGAVAAMARPFQLEDLFWQLDRALGLPETSYRRNGNAAA